MISFSNFFNAYSVFACAFALFWFYSRSTYDHWRKLKVPYVRPFPLLGNIARMTFSRDSLQQMYERLYRQLGDVPFGGIFLLRQPVLLIKNQHLASAIMVKEFKHFTDHDPNVFNPDKQTNPLSANIIFAKGDRWRTLRHKISPVFSPAKVKSMQGRVESCVARMNCHLAQKMEEVDGGESTDVAVDDLFNRLFVDVMVRCIYSVECDSFDSDDVYHRMALEVAMPSPVYAFRFVTGGLSNRLRRLLRIRDYKKEVHNFFMDLALGTVQNRRRNNVSQADALQWLMNLQNSHVDPKFAVNMKRNGINPEKNDQNDEFDEIDIAANSNVLLIAGFETSALTMSYCIYELALNKNIQQKLRDEVKQVKLKWKTLNNDSLNEMAYMSAVVLETLRKYPPLPVLVRECTEDFSIRGTNVCSIKAGTKVHIPIWSIQHDEKNYSNPEVFDPKRFLDDQRVATSKTFRPFGDGPRICIDIMFGKFNKDWRWRFFKPDLATWVKKTWQHYPYYVIARIEVNELQ